MTNPMNQGRPDREPERDPFRTLLWAVGAMLFLAGLVWWGASKCACP